mmetsp:Transcript_18688/g.52824  ORF Transcript_18688/g.52824 Transcript_18688/m.52824 type:complete len:165 (-) Transcript_18688:66-560(-)
MRSLLLAWLLSGLARGALGMNEGSCPVGEDEALATAMERDEPQQSVDGFLELLQVRRQAVNSQAVRAAENSSAAGSADEAYWPGHVHYNPPGPRGGPGHGAHYHGWHGGAGYHRGYHGSTGYHYNPPGPRGGRGHGHTVVHHNPPGPRGGPGRGYTVHHHHHYR